MNNKIPYTNDTDSIKYAPNGQRLMPGETCMIDAPAGEASTAAAVDVDPMQVLSEANAKTIIDALPTLDGDQLDRLNALEDAGKKRKTVIEAIAFRKLELLDADKIDPALVDPAAGNGETSTATA